MSKNKNQNPVNEERKLTSEDAKLLIEKEKQERLVECRKVITENLNRFKCTIECQFLLSADGVHPIVNIVSTE